MSEKLKLINSSSREELYKNILPQLESLIGADDDLISGLSNLTAALKEAFDFLWVGFYFVKGDKLVLGPFQGRIACTRIAKGRGVCGTAWAKAETIVVPDVDLFDGHIACDSSSRSEIVVPIKDSSENVVAILDVDSEKPNHFSEIDSIYLNRISQIIGKQYYQ